MNLFEIENIAFTVMDYKISYIELIGTVMGLISVYYASTANILTWPTGIVNEFALFLLFFQVQLYADMFLQIYFFVVTLYGWRNWKSNAANLPVTSTGLQHLKTISVLLVIGTLLIGTGIKNIHNWLPYYFTLPATYPYADSFVMTGSILATILLARKQLESWYLWILTDLVCVGLYLVKGIYFLSLEYLIFLGMASFGLYRWKKQLAYA